VIIPRMEDIPVLYHLGFKGPFTLGDALIFGGLLAIGGVGLGEILKGIGEIIPF
jgi:hypothetical protein